VKHAVQRGILGTNSAFAPGSRKTTGNLDRVRRSQDPPDAIILNDIKIAVRTSHETLLLRNGAQPVNAV
jgi:hypothetical protein